MGYIFYQIWITTTIVFSQESQMDTNSGCFVRNKDFEKFGQNFLKMENFKQFRVFSRQWKVEIFAGFIR